MIDTMPKDRREISIDPDLNDKLSRPNINASGLIEELVSRYFAYAEIDEAAELTAEARRERQEDLLARAVETLSENGDLRPSNPAVINWAGKTETPPEELIELVEEYDETGEVPEP